MKCKMIPVEIVLGMGGDEGEQRRGWVQVWYIWNIVRTFVNATMYPHQAEEQQQNIVMAKRYANKLPRQESTCFHQCTSFLLKLFQSIVFQLKEQ
jgi:hypothetical protein